VVGRSSLDPPKLPAVCPAMFAACARTRGSKVPPSERSDPLTDEDAFMMTALLDGERGFLTYKSSGHPVAPGSTCELTFDLPSPSVMVWSWEEAWGRPILFKIELPSDTALSPRISLHLRILPSISSCLPTFSRICLYLPVERSPGISRYFPVSPSIPQDPAVSRGNPPYLAADTVNIRPDQG